MGNRLFFRSPRTHSSIEKNRGANKGPDPYWPSVPLGVKFPPLVRLKLLNWKKFIWAKVGWSRGRFCIIEWTKCRIHVLNNKWSTNVYVCMQAYKDPSGRVKFANFTQWLSKSTCPISCALRPHQVFLPEWNVLLRQRRLHTTKIGLTVKNSFLRHICVVFVKMRTYPFLVFSVLSLWLAVSESRRFAARKHGRGQGPMLWFWKKKFFFCEKVWRYWLRILLLYAQNWT
jgi:hypothetical protein